jgi:hypothetical protein
VEPFVAGALLQLLQAGQRPTAGATRRTGGRHQEEEEEREGTDLQLVEVLKDAGHPAGHSTGGGGSATLNRQRRQAEAMG